MDYVDKILDGLNTSQTHAVTTPSNVVQILAPPGSGKTRTLTSRVAHMLSNGLDPRNIIVATFTVKASSEMKDRIGKMIGGGMEDRLVLGTFHSISRRYLIKYGHHIGIKRDFNIADTKDTTSILKRIIDSGKLTQDAGSARARISSLKSKMQHSTTFKVSKAEDQEFAQLYREYDNELAKSNKLDYDDLLLRCVELLQRHPKCVSNVEAVLIDEFQDTNLVQFDLMCLFAAHRKRITIVGDPDQSIYGFRNAEIKNLTRMQMLYPETEVVCLEENYRSSGAILLCALEVIEQDTNRPAKPLVPTHSLGTQPVLRKLPSSGLEAFWLVKEIARMRVLTGRMVKLNDIAILVRSAALTRVIESALTKEGLPYVMVGGMRFFDRLEVRHVLDYLRVIYNPAGNDDIINIINIPPRKIGVESIKNLLEESNRQKLSLWSLLSSGSYARAKLSKAAEQSLSTFVGTIKRAQNMLHKKITSSFVEEQLEQNETVPDEASILTILEYLFKKIAYKEFIEKRYPEDHENRWQNVQELVMQASDVSNAWANGSLELEDMSLPIIDGVEQSEEDNSLREVLGNFLTNVALCSQVDAAEKDKTDSQGSEAEPPDMITISTIHAAKGLEWPVVFVPGAYQGSIPHSRAEDTDEERRLLYVAMTRAQGLLYMSYPAENTRKEQSTLSPFLSPDGVLALVAEQGPKFTPNLLKTLSGTFGRDCPSPQTIANILATSNLESVEDSLFQEWDDSQTGNYDEVGLDERLIKRRKYEKESAFATGGGFSTMGMNAYQNQHQGFYAATGSSYKTTMTDTTSFSVASTTMKFMTARTHLKEVTESGQNMAALTANTSASRKVYKDDVYGKSKTLQEKDKSEEHGVTNPEKTTKGKPAAKSKVKSTAAQRSQIGQSSLTNFFQPKSNIISTLPTIPQSVTGTNPEKSSVRVRDNQDKFIILSSSPPESSEPPLTLLATMETNIVSTTQRRPLPSIEQAVPKTSTPTHSDTTVVKKLARSTSMTAKNSIGSTSITNTTPRAIMSHISSSSSSSSLLSRDRQINAIDLQQYSTPSHLRKEMSDPGPVAARGAASGLVSNSTGNSNANNNNNNNSNSSNNNTTNKRTLGVRLGSCNSWNSRARK